MRTFPNVSPGRSPIIFVNVQAALALGNHARRERRPKFEKPSLRSEAVRYTWSYRSSVAWPKYDSRWITTSLSTGRSRSTVLDSLYGVGATSPRPTANRLLV